MLNRIEIKERAKQVCSQNYWKLVGIVLVGMLLIGAGSIFTTDYSDIAENFKGVSKNIVSGISMWSLAGVAFTIFVGNVIAVGLARICLEAYRGGEYELKDLFAYFTGGNYLRVVGAMALVTLFTGIGFILFIVPGVIVGIGLSRVAYLLAEDPSACGMDALKRSWELMKGHRNEYFVFLLSFIGWILLTAVTAGIVGIFYSNPYMNVACAGWHDEFMRRVQYN